MCWKPDPACRWLHSLTWAPPSHTPTSPFLRRKQSQLRSTLQDAGITRWIPPLAYKAGWQPDRERRGGGEEGKVDRFHFLPLIWNCRWDLWPCVCVLWFFYSWLASKFDFIPADLPLAFYLFTSSHGWGVFVLPSLHLLKQKNLFHLFEERRTKHPPYSQTSSLFHSGQRQESQS